jgi:hypothetical protein
MGPEIRVEENGVEIAKIDPELAQMGRCVRDETQKRADPKVDP